MVLGVLTHGLTAEELEKILATQASPSSVRGRLKELADDGLVEVAGSKRNANGNLVKTWKQKQEDQK
jgi:predicted ArsR family transcriptional regulator